MRPKWTFPASAFRRSRPALIRSVSQLRVILDPWRLPEHPLRSPALASPPPACYFPPGPAAALVSDTGPALAASGAAPAWSSACKPSCRPVVMTGRRPHPHGRQHPWGWGLQLPVAEWLSDSPKIKGCIRLEERWGPGRWRVGGESVIAGCCRADCADAPCSVLLPALWPIHRNRLTLCLFVLSLFTGMARR